jgi:hypothetical protein
MDIVEIACDESGFSGSNLLDPSSPVITHASVDLTTPEAAELLATLRSRFGHRRSSEHKAHLLLRPGQVPAREWFLTALRGRAHVHVVDKRAYVAARVLELLVGEPSYGDGTRLSGDHRQAVAALRERTAFLSAFVAMTRTRRLRQVDLAAVDRFLTMVPSDVPALHALTRTQVEVVLLRLIAGDPSIPPPLEPLVPAVAETALSWSAGRRSVVVVHDEQSALTPQRMARLATHLAQAVFPAPPPLLGVRQVDSREDARVQVADLLAGVARRAATRPGDPLSHDLAGVEVVVGDLSYGSARHADRDGHRRDVAAHDAPGADDRPVPDADTGEHDGVAADPDLVLDHDRV